MFGFRREFTIRIFRELNNGNTGRSKHWSSAHRERNAWRRAVQAAVVIPDNEPEIAYLDYVTKPSDEKIGLIIRRVLGAKQRLWDADSILRGSAKEFERREISIHLHICNPGDYVKRGLAEAVEFVTQDDEGSIVVFVNSRYRSMKYLQDIEKKLDEAMCDTNVLMINGQLQAEDKFHRIRIFCRDGDPELDDMTFRVLRSTPAANAGIDKSSIRRQFRFEWPRDLCTFFQEMGRGSRDGNPSVCNVYGDLQSFEYIRSQTLLDSGDDDNDSTMASPVVGINSALSPLRQVGEAAAATAAGGNTTTARPKSKKYKLGPAARPGFPPDLQPTRPAPVPRSDPPPPRGCSPTQAPWHGSP